MIIKVTVMMFIFSIHAKERPPIEGGESISLLNDKYDHFIKIELKQGTCSATRISYNDFLTSAHCIEKTSNNYLLSKGNMLGAYGFITQIKIHPNYSKYLKELEKVFSEYKQTPKSQKEKRKLLRKKYKSIERFKTLFDIALIKTNKKKGKTTLSFPKIITSNTSFSKRDKIEIIGHGDNKVSWSGVDKEFKYIKTKTNTQLAKTNWLNCPTEYKDSKMNDLENNILSIENKILHQISNQYDKQTYERPMILQGDSGASAIEYDRKGDMIITAIASTHEPYADGSGFPVLKIQYPNGKIKKIQLKEMPKNWGDPNKKDHEFDIIRSQLLKDGYDVGNSKIQITREYQRVSRGQFADLLHPENQIFLKEALN